MPIVLGGWRFPRKAIGATCRSASKILAERCYDGCERLVSPCFLVAANPGPLGNDQMRRIFVEIISACRALEHPIRVAFLGPEFTYLHEAARAFGTDSVVAKARLNETHHLNNASIYSVAPR